MSNAAAKVEALHFPHRHLLTVEGLGAAEINFLLDLADKAANSYTKEFLFGLTHENRSLLQLVDDALRRIEDQTFGECIACHQELQQKRLEAVPWTRYCISCQEKKEQGLL